VRCATLPQTLHVTVPASQHRRHHVLNLRAFVSKRAQIVAPFAATSCVCRTMLSCYKDSKKFNSNFVSLLLCHQNYVRVTILVWGARLGLCKSIQWINYALCDGDSLPDTDTGVDCITGVKYIRTEKYWLGISQKWMTLIMTTSSRKSGRSYKTQPHTCWQSACSVTVQCRHEATHRKGAEAVKHSYSMLTLYNFNATCFGLSTKVHHQDKLECQTKVTMYITLNHCYVAINSWDLQLTLFVR
jgi:hypothetical protein